MRWPTKKTPRTSFVYKGVGAVVPEESVGKIGDDGFRAQQRGVGEEFEARCLVEKGAT
jgi:hypothetical protein